jgi:hypothetical protein
VLVLIAAIGPLHAQDVLPGSLSCHVGGTDCDTLCLYFYLVFYRNLLNLLV